MFPQIRLSLRKIKGLLQGPRRSRLRLVTSQTICRYGLEGFEPPHYKPFGKEASEGFYIRRFKAPANFSNRRMVLRFDGVWSSAEVWLNGEPLGRHDSGFTRFEYDVSRAIRFDQENVLAVRVRQLQHDYLFDTNDDWSLGGIYRDVTLLSMPKERWLDRVDASTSFDRDFRDADLSVRIMVHDEHRRTVAGNLPDHAGDGYDLQVTLKNAQGAEVAQRLLHVAPHNGTGRETSLALHVAAPEQWTAETPALYALSVRLLENSVATHEITRQIGFRQISTAGGIFRVNGQAVKLRGVDRHDEHPDVGRATTAEHWAEDIRLMKEANINFIRSSHYPPAEGFLDLCDKLGMYVEDEVPMGFGGDHAYDPSFAAAVMLRSYETVERDINHPSILLWSIGNEDPLTSLHLASIRTVKGLDPTRPVLLPWRSEEWLPAEIDMLAPHYFNASAYDKLAAHSSRPILTTEFTHAYGTEGFGGLEDTWHALTSHPAGAGGAIWMWADQGLNIARQNTPESKKNPLLLVDDGIDGIVGAYREPQRDYWETKAVYAQVHAAADHVDFAPGQKSVRIPVLNEYDFTDLSGMTIEWRLFEDARELDHGKVTPEGKPHAVAWIEVPLRTISGCNPSVTRYAQLSFRRKDGSELTRNAIELLAPCGPALQTAPAAHITVQQAETTTITAGDVTYSFDRATGLLQSATRKGKTLFTNLMPTLWRPLSTMEENIARRESGLTKLPDLNLCQAHATEWKISESSTEAVLNSLVQCRVDEANSYQIAFTYTIHQTGTLHVHFSIDPRVQVKWIAQAGLAMDAAPELRQMHWLGLGPLDCYPNEKAAGVLGVWGGELGQAETTGNKIIRWVQLTASDHAGFRVDGVRYLRASASRPEHLELLSSELGRTSKARRPEWPEQQLNTEPGAPFAGDFVFRVVP